MSIPERGKPLVRHPALQPLSREHHQGLLLGQYLRLDVPDYRKYPSSLAGRLKLAQQHFEGRWFPHFEREESILIPALRGIDPEMDKMCDTIIEEHRRMLGLLERASLKTEEEKECRELLHQLGRLLVRHIRREERSWYEKIQELMPEEALEGLAL